MESPKCSYMLYMHAIDILAEHFSLLDLEENAIKLPIWGGKSQNSE